MPRDCVAIEAVGRVARGFGRSSAAANNRLTSQTVNRSSRVSAMPRRWASMITVNTAIQPPSPFRQRRKGRPAAVAGTSAAGPAYGSDGPWLVSLRLKIRGGTAAIEQPRQILRRWTSASDTPVQLNTVGQARQCRPRCLSSPTWASITSVLALPAPRASCSPAAFCDEFADASTSLSCRRRRRMLHRTWLS